VSYAIRISVFEGPLDLLLHLIRSHKLDIRDIPIARVAEQYLEYLALMESLDLDVAGEFLVMAATLMEIKSRMLLPRPEPLPDADDAQDPRAELVARLLEYERFQQVAEQLREIAEQSGRSFPRQAVEEWEGAVPLVELRPADLLAALRRLKPEEGNGNGGSAPLRVRRQAINLRQRMGEILRRILAQEEPLPFSSLLARAGRRIGRAEILATFLAILELVRLGQVTAWQDAVFGDIYLRAAVPSSEPPAGG
jgi:segregation and condensation protein A